MSPRLLFDIDLVDASVSPATPFAAAAGLLCSSRLSAIAVLDEERRVRGLFTEDDLIAGIFPPYLRELHHTSFVTEGLSALVEGKGAEENPVERHMREPVVVERDSSALHVAEKFLHCQWGSLAVVEDGRFVGMLRQVDFCIALLAHARESREA